MGRHRPSGSYGHRVHRVDRDCYRLSWVVDRYYPGSRLRYPRPCKRFADLAGARRFSARWSVPMPPGER